MSKTAIEWCHRHGTKPETWNPTTGCNKVSQGCKNCYAEIMHRRLAAMGQKKYSHPFLDGAVPHEDTLLLPTKWITPRTVFVNSMSDLFHVDVPYSFILEVFATMAATPWHTYIILTKRPVRMFMFCNQLSIKPDGSVSLGALGGPKPLPNVWLGVSVENQESANERIPTLLQTPAAIRFLSCEPLLGPVDLNAVRFSYQRFPPYTDVLIGKGYEAVTGRYSHENKIDWVIVGGESGHNARPMHPDWVRQLRNQCQAVKVPFFFKQWGAYAPHMADSAKSFTGVVHNGIGQDMCKVGKQAAGRMLDGIEHNGFPS